MSGVVGYLYQSAKDSIKWHKQKPKEFINLVMSIGRLVYLSDEDFGKANTSSSVDDVIQLSEINNFAKIMQKVQGKKEK